MDLRREWKQAKAILTACQLGISNAGYDVPDVCFVSDGLPAWDGELLAVSHTRTFVTGGDASTSTNQMHRVHLMRAHEYAVWYLLEVPTFEVFGNDVVLPPAGDIEHTAEINLGARAAMWEGILNAVDAGKLGEDPMMTFIESTSVGPEGGFTGRHLRVAMSAAADPPEAS